MIRLYLVAFVTSLLVSLAATPVSMALARRFGAMDQPDSRKIHVVPKPRWGGIGIMAGVLSGLFVLWYFFPIVQKLLIFTHNVERSGKMLLRLNLGDQLAGILFGTMLLFVVGLVDDRRPIKPGMKLLFQIIAAYVAMTYGVRIYGLSLPGFEAFSYFPLWLMQVITILWLVGLCNAVNLIDGLDGLAVGTVAIIAGAFLAVALVQKTGHSLLFSQQMKLAGLISSALLGGSIGFLVYNFFPSQVFMGDSGSLSVGFLIACTAVIGAFKTAFLVVLLIPFILVALPVADMTFAFGRRLFHRKNPFSPDRGHLHHRFIDAGWTQREVVLMAYVVTLILAFISVTSIAVRNA